MGWHFRYYVLKQNPPLISTFQLTHLCNLKCKMCNLWRDPQRGTLVLNDFRSIIAGLGDLGCCYVSLSGGEPLLIKDISSYLNFAKKHIPYVNLVTNGYLLDEKFARQLNHTRIDMVSISIDGLENTHDQIRGLKGSFAKAVEAIVNLKRFSSRTRVTVNTVISPWNIDEIIPLNKLTNQLGAFHKFQPLYQHPVFEGQAGKSSEWQMDADKIKKLEEIVLYLKRQKNVSNSIYYLSSIRGYFLGENKHGIFRERCKSVHFYCEIRENNKVYPCIEGMGWENGFPINQDIKSVLGSPEYKKSVLALHDCKRCQEILPLCYMESRITFPLTSYIRYTLLPALSFLIKKC